MGVIKNGLMSLTEDGPKGQRSDKDEKSRRYDGKIVDVSKSEIDEKRQKV